MTTDNVQRNNLPGNPLAANEFFRDIDLERPHPGEILFNVVDLQDLVMKSDIPEKMVGMVSHMLWKAERYNIPALRQRIQWYLVTRLGKDREARKEYMQVVMKYVEPSEENEFLGG